VKIQSDWFVYLSFPNNKITIQINRRNNLVVVVFQVWEYVGQSTLCCGLYPVVHFCFGGGETLGRVNTKQLFDQLFCSCRNFFPLLILEFKASLPYFGIQSHRIAIFKRAVPTQQDVRNDTHTPEIHGPAVALLID